ncbi:MAG TPA: MATE family efflux transporter [Gemmataceae bacterium]|nr:MATE family efflux transporter [Gemmataceae bacterium]
MESELTATSIAFTLNMIAFLPAMGLGQAIAVLVGQRLGENRPSFFTFYLLPFTFYLLPFAFYLLPFTFCLLPFAFCLLPLSVKRSSKIAVRFVKGRK